MKKMYLLLVILCISLQSLYSVEFDKSKLPKLLGANNWGREFYFSFTTSGGSWECDGNILYITCPIRTKVTVEVPGKGYKKIHYTVPNDIIAFVLDPGVGQPYAKYDHQKPEADKVWCQSGVHVIADDPIICYGMTKFEYNTEGFLAIPKHLLGKEYIVSSWEDISDNINNWWPCYASITAAYDKTKVIIKMGGNEFSTTVNGQKSGETTSWNLDAGDVLLIGTLGNGSDLTGSKITASNPVAVVSGNYYTSVPATVQYGNMHEEMELPMDNWGRSYHVSRILGRLKNSIIRVFAKESSTTVYKDNQLIGTIQYSGGTKGLGWIEMRSDTGASNPVTIHSDKPINVIQYNTSTMDDGIETESFQMQLIPIEQYSNEIVFNTPGIRGGGIGFNSNYLNLCYEATDSNTIPDDFEFAQVEGGLFVWKSLKEMSPNPGESFKLLNNINFKSKTILLPGDGVYKLRANKPFQAYMYGFSFMEGYGFPASVSLKKLDIIDSLPPVPEWTINCSGDVNTDSIRYVTDKTEKGYESSGLSMIYLMSDSSYNYTLDYGDIMSADDSTTWWKLNVIDKSKDARAFVRFLDRAGNDTIIYIQFKSPKLRVSESKMTFRGLGLGDSYYKYILYNDSPDNIVHINQLSFNKNIENSNDKELYILQNDLKTLLISPFEINPLDSLSFFIVSSHKRFGTYRDSIYADIENVCSHFLLSSAEQLTGNRILSVTDFEFHPVITTDTAYGYVTLKNLGNFELNINRILYPTGFAQLDGFIIDSKNLINKNIKINPGDSLQLEMLFIPKDTNSKEIKLTFNSDSDEDILFDNVSILKGRGLSQPIIINSLDFGKCPISTDLKPVNPIKKFLKIMNQDSFPIKIINVFNPNSKIISIDTNDFNGVVLPINETVSFPVYFHPNNYGDFSTELTIKIDRKWYFKANIFGTGNIGYFHSNYSDYNDTTIINDFENFKTHHVSFINDTNSWDYSDTIIINDLIEEHILTNLDVWDDSSAFRYDKSLIKFPYILPPGERMVIEVQTVARKKYNGGKLKTISNALSEEVINLWINGKTATEIKYLNEDKINIYPNPTEDILIIDKLPINTSKIQIFDESGKEVRTIYIKNQLESLKISTKDLPIGNYILRLFVGAEVLDRKFVVVR